MGGMVFLRLKAQKHHVSLFSEKQSFSENRETLRPAYGRAQVRPLL